ncbi:hypothetical protein CTA2_6036 [Colletotrichum tanaceti]|uniref:Uncharacterized protein n=1 Tax=Colletotrichum tanaceti TaxID=1306861 RepID=A0A4U6X7D1_9PEZI|nr:hypothetical protein CTA2_6036 [Colletotrichum tanaceti]TKW51235.1 hypothetical protein CTA1_2032 [Colletotrichum tanaceti]
MTSEMSWRRLCVIAWLICRDHLACALEVVPQSRTTFETYETTRQLTPRTTRPNASCPVKGYNVCGNGMADYFCCPSNTTCLVLAEKTTTLCCPEGASCDTISPIICDITAQDVVENPTSPIHTTKLKELLPSCGSRCCPFGYTCRDGSACVLVRDQKSRTSASVSPTTRTKTATPRTPTATRAATSTTPSERIPAVSPPSASLGQEHPTPSPTGPSETTPAAASSTGNVIPGGIIAGTTVAAVASVAGLTFLLWLKRRSISEKVAAVRFLGPWQQLREQGSEQDVALPRYNSPPPAYTTEMKAPSKHPHSAFRHYSPESIGDAVPVELPATPVSFSIWNVRPEGEARRPRSHYEPYRRP